MEWHTLSEKEVIEKLGSNEEGLRLPQVNERLVRFGDNKLKKTRHFNALKVFLDQFKSFLIIVLIFAAILAFFMESMIDAIVILAIVILNAGLGFFQEYKAEKAIRQLQKMMVPEVKVLRNGKVVRINSEKIVPGDILILSEGDKVMADARILSINGLKVNEAALTGESFPVLKILKKLGISMPLAERINMVYQGTEIVSGNGRAIIVNTGMNTELGKISELVQKVKSEKNPLRDRLDGFAKKIGIFILLLAMLIVGLFIWRGGSVFDSFLVAVSLAVSAIPEGLPAVISLGLAFATRKMLKKNVLVRKLPASETLGRATVICVDKTGTLTEEKMKVFGVYSDGKFSTHLNDANKFLFKIGILCNKARYEIDKKGEMYFIGDPTETALIVSAQKVGLDKKKETEENIKVKEFPFSSERKMMSVVRKTSHRYVSYVKGAPERILERCSYQLLNGRKTRLNEREREKLMSVYEDMAKKGLRVLGFAYKDFPTTDNVSIGFAEKDLIFVGFQGMIDPPRKEVRQAIKLTKEAGIKVLMMTGDSKLTADAVAKEIGLNGKSVDYYEFKKMSDKELFDNIEDISIFSRISPEDKLRVVDILKKKNEIVAMTGDGVNDSLALKRADIGIAMGIRGTEVAKDSSDIVLIDDNFASIVEGVKEGRRVYDNIKKFIKFLLAANFSEVFLILIVLLIWKNPEFLPLLPLQILWINLVTDSFPALALSSEPMEIDAMKRKPTKEGILKNIIGFIVLGGIIATGIGFLFFIFNIGDIDKARTMVVTSSIMFEMFLVFNSKSNKFVFKSPINKYLIYAVLFSIGLHLVALYTPINQLFYFVPLGILDWLLIIALGFVGFLVIELYKVYGKRLFKK